MGKRSTNKRYFISWAFTKWNKTFSWTVIPNGSSVKYVGSDFLILDLPPRSTCTYAFNIHPSPLIQAYGEYFFKEDMTDIFCELLPIKETKTTLQKIENTIQSYRKMSKQNTKKSPGIEFTFFNCTWKMRMDNFGYLNNSLYFMSILQRTSEICYGLWTLTVWDEGVTDLHNIKKALKQFLPRLRAARERDHESVKAWFGVRY